MTLLPSSSHTPLSVYERGRVELRHIIIRSICAPLAVFVLVGALMYTFAPHKKEQS